MQICDVIVASSSWLRKLPNDFKSNTYKRELCHNMLISAAKKKKAETSKLMVHTIARTNEINASKSPDCFLNYYYLYYFSPWIHEMEEIFSMDPRLNLNLTSKKECIEKLVLVSGQ